MINMIAKEKAAKTNAISSAIELHDGTIITSKTSALLGTSAALILNAVKHLAGIPHEEKLIPVSMIEPIQNMKVSYLKGNNPRLHTDEVLIALSATAAHNEIANLALEQLPKLKSKQLKWHLLSQPFSVS